MYMNISNIPNKAGEMSQQLKQVPALPDLNSDGIQWYKVVPISY